MSERVYLALGSNLGDRLANLSRALQALSPYAAVQRVSPVVETDPWGVLDQPDFLNQVAEAETDLPPLELLAGLKEIERTLGRQPGVRYGPRLIDLDILLYGELCAELPGLSLPHPRMAERAFVLVPLAALAPHALHPPTGRTIAELLGAVDARGVRTYLPPEGVRIPPDLAAALAQTPRLSGHFNRLSAARQREIIAQMEAAPTAERLSAALERLSAETAGGEPGV